MHSSRGVCNAEVYAVKNNKTFLAYSTKGFLVILYNFDQRTKKVSYKTAKIFVKHQDLNKSFQEKKEITKYYKKIAKAHNQ